MREELKNGKWSEWISNEGNPHSERPLGFIGAREEICEVIFRDGDTAKSTVKGFDFSVMFLDSDIMKYRYWIPDTETQTEPKTEPKTEKEKDMNTWTEKDEEVLKELLDKKGKAEFENKAKLTGLMIKINHQSLYVESNKVDEMIKHADELIDALQPYRKQK
jgi:hypothetical protein